MSTTTKPTPAAMRAAEAVHNEAVRTENFEYIGFHIEAAALAIDRETGLPELVEAMEQARCYNCGFHFGDTAVRSAGHDWRSCPKCKPARAALAKARGTA